jgi:hypothetical protein
MNSREFSASAHRDPDYCNPISAAKIGLVSLNLGLVMSITGGTVGG